MVADAGWPRLDVLLCTHNGARFLPQQLETLLRQERPPGCLHIHDWGSTDGTLQIIESHRRSAPPSIRWNVVAHAEAPGAARSFLQATTDCLESNATFDYLLFCDQDDVWHLDKLDIFASTIQRRRDLQLVYCDVEMIDESGRVLRPNYLGPGGAFGRPMDMHHPATLFVNTVSGMSMAVSRELLVRGRAAWSSPDWFMHDWAVTIMVCLTQAPVHFIAESLVGYRQHTGNLVGGLGHHTSTRSFAAVLRQARAYVCKVHRQYRMCTALCGDLKGLHLPLAPGRLHVAWTILRGRSFRPFKTIKVALGYALLWPRSR